MKKSKRLSKAKTSNTTKKPSSLQKARAAKQALSEKIKMLKARFKQKLQQISTTTYEKALRDFHRTHTKKLEAKEKALATAAAKFEKKYEKKISKKTSKRGKNKRRETVIHTPSMAGNRLIKRGRPRKAA